MNAVQWAKEHEYPAVEIRYDYEGVEKMGDRCVAGQDTAYQQVCGTYAGSSRADKDIFLQSRSAYRKSL